MTTLYRSYIAYEITGTLGTPVATRSLNQSLIYCVISSRKCLRIPVYFQLVIRVVPGLSGFL